MKKRSFLKAAALAPWAHPALAQKYPERSIRLLVPFPAGGATDILARALALTMGEKLGVSLVVENRPGAGGSLGSDLIAKSAADGYSLLMATSSTHSIGPLLNPKLPYDANVDFTAIGLVASSANLLLVPASLGARTLADFLTLARAKPGQFNYGSSGNGTIVHLTSELFKSQARLFITHIPYRGTALVVPDLKTASVHLLVDSIVSAQPHLQDGKLVPLAVTSAKRSALMPSLPTVAETLPGFESTTWFGLYAPKGLPVATVGALNAAMNAALTDKTLIERLARLGAEPGGGSAQQFANHVAADSAKWKQLIAERSIKAE